jgi:hypothetical protein
MGFCMALQIQPMQISGLSPFYFSPHHSSFRRKSKLTGIALRKLGFPLSLYAFNRVIRQVNTKAMCAANFHYCPGGESLIFFLSYLQHFVVQMRIVIIQSFANQGFCRIQFELASIVQTQDMYLSSLRLTIFIIFFFLSFDLILLPRSFGATITSTATSDFVSSHNTASS